MIKFFRKIRLKSLSENKFSKYLIYAIGEIILVVIGILIAIYINNDNEKSKMEKDAIKQLEILSENLYLINKNNYEIYYLQVQDSVLQSYKKNNDEFFPKGFVRYYDKYPLKLSSDIEYTLNENLDMLIDDEKSFPSEYKNVIKTIKATEIIRNGMVSIQQDLLEIDKRNTQILTDNFDWYDDISAISLKKRKQYFMDDYLFQNRLFHFIQDFKLYASQANRIRMMKSKIWLETQLLKTNVNINDLKNGLKEMNLNELPKTKCQQDIDNKSLPSFLVWNLVYNSTKDTIAISRWDNNNKITDYLLPLTSAVLSGGINSGIRIIKNDSCNIKYENLINGFIFLEN